MTGRGKDAQQNGFGGRKRRPSENDDFRKNQNAKQSKRLNDRDDGDEMDPEDEEIVKLMARLMAIECCVCGERPGQRVFLPCTHVRFCNICGPDPGRCSQCVPNTTHGSTGNSA